MKLITYKYKNKEAIGALSADGKYVYTISESKSMNDFVSTTSQADIKRLEKELFTSDNVISYDEVTKCSPIPTPKQDIICLGVNYMAHAEESARYKKELFDGKREYAVYFSKRVNEAVPDGGVIHLNDKITNSLDYEAELAVILGKDARNVKAEDAEDYIFGYTILNDISARDIQTRHKQWYMGKSLADFCPMGPWIVTKNELGKAPVLKITSKVNGELRQNSSTDLIIFKPDYVIEELSSYTTLKAGTIISMGTPSGVGMGFTPPKFLKSGDVVECEIEKIGKLKNIIK